MSAPLLVLRVKGRPPDLHHGKHMTRWARAREQAMRRSFVKVMAQGERHRAGLPANVRHKDSDQQQFSHKRRLHIAVWWRGVKRDDSNLMQDLKADLDALVDAGWLVDDNREWLELDYPPEYLVAFTERDVAVEYRLFAL